MSHNQRKAARSKKNEAPRLKTHSKKDSKSSKGGGKGSKDNDVEHETLWEEPKPESEPEELEEEDDDDDDEPEYEVEEILDKKIKRGVVQYLVKWKGFSLSETTWEPESNLENAPLKIKNYEEQLLLKEKDNQKEKEKDKDKEKEKNKHKEKEKNEVITKTKPNKSPIEDQKEEVKGQEHTTSGRSLHKEAATTSTKQIDLKAVLEPEVLTGKRMRDLLADEPDKEIDDSKKKQVKTDKPDKTEKAEKSEKREKKKGTGDEDSSLKQSQVIENKKDEKKIPEEKKKVKEQGTSQVEKKNPKMQVEEKAPQPPEKPNPREQEAEEDELTFKIKKLSSKANSIQIDSDLPNLNPSTSRREEPQYFDKPLFVRQESGQKPLTEIRQGPTMSQLSNNESNVLNTDIANKKDVGLSLSRIMQDEGADAGTEETMVDNEPMETERAIENTEKAPEKEIIKIRKKTGGEYGSLEKGDVPLKVLGIRPIKEANDLEVMVSWKARDNGTKPYNSKVMRIDLLRDGYWMPLIEFYESKMKLESSPNFDAAVLSKY